MHGGCTWNKSEEGSFQKIVDGKCPREDEDKERARCVIDSIGQWLPSQEDLLGDGCSVEVIKSENWMFKVSVMGVHFILQPQ